jgi:solute carrier family 15 (oligopeptide transporter), member 1
MFHSSSMSIYLCSIIGAVIADSWWGKFKTIFYLSIVYAIGSSVIAIGSVEIWKLPANVFTIIGLVLISIGSGGIKPCVSAFGGEQFKLPEQTAQLLKFFSIFYFSINLGSVFTTFITPLLRDMRCFGMDQCFFAGFGLPAVLMFIAIIIFVSGSSMYIKNPPQGNVLTKVIKCIFVRSYLNFLN